MTCLRDRLVDAVAITEHVDIFRGMIGSTWIAQENIDRIVESATAVMKQAN
jgi:hypothetical protein